MHNNENQRRFAPAALMAFALVVGVPARVAFAEPKSSKDIIQKKRIDPEKGRV